MHLPGSPWPPSGAPAVRAVVFDLDDTLLDHTGSVRAALSAWLPQETASSPP
jgi:FMN phosphatase YigB (HAD superfamily)